MNKSGLIEQLAQELKLSTREASSILNTILASMTEALICGESIEIRGFGSFSVKQYDSYDARNPKTGEKTVVKPKKLPVFKLGKDLRERVDAASKSR